MKYGLLGLAVIVVLWLMFLSFAGAGRAKTKRQFPSWWLKPALCVHSHEASWRDSGAPYFGGMQMDRAFQKTYGTWLYRNRGTADRWSQRQQLNVAYRAYHGWKNYRARGWTPWPNTSRMCGLA